MPVPRAASRFRNWRRGCSRSIRPTGPVPSAAGSGVSKSFSPRAVRSGRVTRSLRDGALRWGDANWYQVLESGLFPAYKIDPETPYGKLPARFKKVLWEGAGSREFDFRWKGRRMSYEYRKTWQGILRVLERRYRETTSDSRRHELERFMVTSPVRWMRRYALAPREPGRSGRRQEHRRAHLHGGDRRGAVLQAT